MTDPISHGAPAGPGDESPPSAIDLPDVLAGEVLAAAPRQERSRRSREALLAAARSRFASNGYEATAVEDIAKDAGVAVGAFYLHFRSKRQVLLVLVDRLVQELGSEPWSIPGDDAETVMKRIRQRFSSVFVYAGIYRAWSEAMVRDHSLTELHERIEAWVTAAITAALSVAASAPRARANVDVRAVSYMLSMIFWRLLDARTTDRSALADTLVAALRNVLYEDGSDAERPAAQDP
jgi:AcrR family transcriptional regulator